MKRNPHDRYQVLFDALTPGENTIVNCRTKKDAEAEKRRREQAGYHNVGIWDTQNNPLSGQFRL